MSEAFGLRERGQLVNAVLTDRGRLVLRTPAGLTGPIAFDAKRPADVEILGPTERRLTGSRGGAERTQLVEVSARGGASVTLSSCPRAASTPWCGGKWNAGNASAPETEPAAQLAS